MDGNRFTSNKVYQLMGKKNITADDIRKLMLRSFRRFSSGETPESTAYREIAMLGNILKAYEATAIEERLKAIERSLTQTRYNDSEE